MPNPPQLIQRLIRGLDITEPEAAGLYSRLTPILALEDLTDFDASDEFAVRPSVGSIWLPAAAGFQARAALWNGADSGVLAEVSWLEFWSDTAGEVRMDLIAGGALGSPGFRRFRDGRIAGKPACLPQGENAGSSAPLLWSFAIGADDRQFLPVRFMIPPGQMLFMEHTVQNTTLDVMWAWRERLLRR
jgi:hypothetical protein